ncbi:MAG TPA: helix-turn-helix transcriptional regulator [Gammaproteobacteria bacterium]
MDLSPSDIRLESLGDIDLFKTDARYDFKLTDIVRKRQPPLLMLINGDAELLYTSAPAGAGATHPHSAFTQRLVEEALVEVQRLFKQRQPVDSVVKQLIVDKPGERCALIVLGNHFFCLRLFSLQDARGEHGELYAALIEPISEPQTQKVDPIELKNLYLLSNREIDVLQALMSGSTDKQIAAKLDVSVDTVRAYLKPIRAKLNARTRTAIVSIVHRLQAEGATADKRK